MTTNQGMMDDSIPDGTSVNPQLADALHARDTADIADQHSQYEQQQAETSGIDISTARAALEERKRLMPEYLEHYFLEDLPPIDPEDPFNQGIYMRYRINQIREVSGKEPVV